MLPLRRGDVLLDGALLRGWPLPANEQGDKRARGTVLVVGGSERTPGAILLAGTAALRMGAGRLQIATAPEVTTAVAVAMPEALVVSSDANDGGSLGDLIATADAVVVGPGLGDLDEASDLLTLVFERATDDAIIVVDALGIRALPQNRSHLAHPERLIITPNREELDALVDDEREATDEEGGGRREQAVAQEYGLTVVSFGCVAAGDGRVWFDPVAVSGLGTSGAGDVLAGVAGGAGARCDDAVQAACWSALCHRLAATRLSEKIAPTGYLARELADEIALALAELAQ